MLYLFKIKYFNGKGGLCEATSVIASTSTKLFST